LQELFLKVLFVSNLFQPIDAFPFKDTGKSDVGHGGSGGRSMPMLNTRRKPDNITCPDLHNRTAPFLYAANSGGDN